LHTIASGPLQSPLSLKPSARVPQSNFLSYENSTYGISILYPSNSTVDQQVGDPAIRNIQHKGDYFEIDQFNFPKVTKFDVNNNKVLLWIAHWNQYLRLSQSSH